MGKFKNLMSKIFIVFTMALILGILGGSNVQAIDSNQTIKINNKSLTFNHIYYVDANNGNDTTGDGSQTKPFQTIYKAVNICSNGDGIFAQAGTYDVTYTGTEYGCGGLYDYGKSITFIGVPGKTIFMCDGIKNTSRDHHAICTYGDNTSIYNIIFKVDLASRTTNYTNAVFGRTSSYVKAQVYNCVFNYGTEIPSMIYDNNNSSKVTVNNCSFNVGGNIISSYTGQSNVFLYNCSNNKSFSKDITNNYSLEEITYDSNYNITSEGWKNKGTGTNPDGSVANIGVYGGEFTWINNTIPNSGIILNIEPEKNKIKLNETVSANLTIDNIKDIAAEDIRIKYDNTKLQFLGATEVDGIKLVKNDAKDGELRFILASKGVANVVEAKKALLKLNFKGITAGDALVDVTKGRVSDGITMEKDLTDDQCGQATITIDNEALTDVNKDGQFTLLDLAIDGRHYSEDPESLTQYNTDIVVNKAIDDDDLVKIGEYMLANPNYKF